MAQMMIDHSEEFFGGGAGKPRILELGAGTGLVSLTAAKMLSSTHPMSVIKATDFYDAVLENLRFNVSLNLAESMVTVEHLDWSTFNSPGAKASTRVKEDVEGRYDVILGTDICYSPPHVSSIYNTIYNLLGFNAIFHLLVPLRPGLEGDCARSVEETFNGVGSGPVLQVNHKESVIGGGVGENSGSGEVEYVYYRIGWA